MFRKTILVAVTLLCQISIAQYEPARDIEFEISRPYDVVDAPSKNYFEHEGFVFSIKIQKKSIFVQKFDSKTMKQVFMRELPRPKADEIEGVFKFGDRFYLMYNLYNKGRTTEQLFYREISFDKGTFKGAAKALVSTNGKVGGDIGVANAFWGGFKKINKFGINFSKDKSRMLVNYRMVPKEKDDSKSYDIIGLFVFDSDLRQVWGEEVEMPYTEKEMENIDYSVDSEGNAYILSTVFDDIEGGKRNRDKPDYHVELLKKEPKSDRLRIAKLDLGEKFVRTAWLFESPEDLMVCAGYYGNEKRARGVDGVFYMKADKDCRLYDAHHYEIPVEVLNQYVSKRTQKKNEKREEAGEAQFYNLKLRNLKFYEDGSMLIIGEQHYIVESTTTTGGVRSTTYTYFYNDILATKIEASGDLAWMIKIPKRQRGSAGIGSMSYKHYFKNGMHYFMFIDNVKNQNLPLDQEPSYHVDNTFGFLTAIIVDDRDGTSSTQTILDMKNANGMKLYQFAPSRTLQLSEEEFLFEAYKKKKEDVMVKIRLKA